MSRGVISSQAYNAQAAVSEDQIIVGHGVTNDGTDAEHLAPMMERVRDNCGAMPKVLSADTGYLVCACHNLLKLFRAEQLAATPA